MRNAATALSRVRMPWSAPHCSSNCFVSCEATTDYLSRSRSAQLSERLHAAVADPRGRPLGSEEADQPLRRLEPLRSGHDRSGEHLIELNLLRERAGIIDARGVHDLAHPHQRDIRLSGGN